MKFHFETLLWAAALLLLYFMDAAPETPSLCLFRFIGFAGCPGCGIGHAIHHALHLRFTQSFHEHVLGLPATAALLYQTAKPFFSTKNKPHEFATMADDAAGASAR